MKGFERQNTAFSLCGLNCALCPMHLAEHCPGCGGGEGNQSCALARCAIEHGKPEYCFECGEYLCEKYRNLGEYDSFITHLHQKEDMEKARKSGLDDYMTELSERERILHELLLGYNDNRKKTLFCLAANLCSIESLREVMTILREQNGSPNDAAALLNAAAKREGVTLRLRKKEKQ